MKRWERWAQERLSALLAAMAAGFCSLVSLTPVSADPAPAGPFHIYLNADQTGTLAAGSSLVLGLEAGLRAGAGPYDVPRISVITRDHKNNLRRSAHLIDEALADPATLAVMGGMHTTHYLRHGPRINEEGLVLLLPMSSGEVLTRMAFDSDNFIFRLSIDDRKSAPFLARQAARAGCRRVAALALGNGWGERNAEAVLGAVAADEVETLPTVWIRGDAEKAVVSVSVAALEAAAPDCVFFMLPARVGALAANVLAEWETPPRIFSHSGVLSGGFELTAQDAVWERLEMSILTTCHFGALNRDGDPAEDAHAEARALLRSGAVAMPMAFVHAYDLSLVVQAAVEQAQNDPRWPDGRRARGAALRDALEALDTPVDGLLRRYERPYGPVTDPGSSGHEALRMADLCLGQMRPDGRLVAARGRAIR